ncbi:hypothetical protein N8J89_26950 [Crossiella sp. CA-258035]|uniref:hypothetical protein n=1 Tax=Crossiella sp. CA-258035 TaxID=2981138 RepID=UPI0024BD1282|nr:hypothetical protein [Crossiella sp. CA-258035]WHT16760.1 hypothetical protein N8J89_26950 [Crossiella sp. CA-258035]
MRRLLAAALLTPLAATMLVAGTAQAAPADVPDPLVNGTHQVSEAPYDLGDSAYTPPGFAKPVELAGQVYYPSDAAKGPFPLVLFLHGRHATCMSAPTGGSASLAWPCTQGRLPIPSHRGYDYAARALASHGYAVVSISANGINAVDNSDAQYGMVARGHLVLKHLDLWRDWRDQPGAPIPQEAVRSFDLGKIGLMGHSRGGEGVVRAVELNSQRPQPYAIKAILPLAPTDFHRRIPLNLPVGTLIPTCDGDLSDLQGVHYYDDARYADANDIGVHTIFTVLGANHNYFNTNWAPSSGLAGSLDDWRSSNTSSQCHPSQSTRLTEEQQRKVGNGYLGSFFRHYLGGDAAFAPLWKGEVGTPASIAPATVLVSYHAPSQNNRRLDINRFAAADSDKVNQLGGQVVPGGTLTSRLCGGTASTTDVSCLNTKQASRQREPHRGWGTLGVSAQRLLWGHISDTLSNTIPVAYQDVRKFGAVRFRAAVDFTDPANPAGVAQDLQVVVTDRAGGRSSVPVAQFGKALDYPHVPPGTPDVIPHLLFNQVRVPLSAFSGVDLSRVDSVYLAFNKTPKGAIALADLSFTD